MSNTDVPTPTVSVAGEAGNVVTTIESQVVKHLNLPGNLGQLLHTLSQDALSALENDLKDLVNRYLEQAPNAK